MLHLESPRLRGKSWQEAAEPAVFSCCFGVLRDWESGIRTVLPCSCKGLGAWSFLEVRLDAVSLSPSSAGVLISADI